MNVISRVPPAALKFNKEIKMNNSLMQIANGFLFGSGLILAAMLFRVVLHSGFCG